MELPIFSNANVECVLRIGLNHCPNLSIVLLPVAVIVFGIAAHCADVFVLEFVIRASEDMAVRIPAEIANEFSPHWVWASREYHTK